MSDQFKLPLDSNSRWLAHHSATLWRDKAGAVTLRLDPRPEYGTPIETWNGALIAAAIAAVARICSKTHKEDNVEVTLGEMSSPFGIPADLSKPLCLTASLIGRAGRRALVSVAWYNESALSDVLGIASCFVDNVGKRQPAVEPAQAERRPLPEATPDSVTGHCRHLLSLNLYFSAVGFQNHHVGDEALVCLDPAPWMLNPSGDYWSPEVFASMADMLVCTAAVPSLGRALVTTELGIKLFPLVRVPAAARIWGSAKVLAQVAAAFRPTAAMEGRLFYLNTDGREVVFAAVNGTIVNFFPES